MKTDPKAREARLSKFVKEEDEEAKLPEGVFIRRADEEEEKKQSEPVQSFSSSLQ